MLDIFLTLLNKHPIICGTIALSWSIFFSILYVCYQFYKDFGKLGYDAKSIKTDKFEIREIRGLSASFLSGIFPPECCPSNEYTLSAHISLHKVPTYKSLHKLWLYRLGRFSKLNSVPFLFKEYKWYSYCLNSYKHRYGLKNVNVLFYNHLYYHITQNGKYGVYSIANKVKDNPVSNPAIQPWWDIHVIINLNALEKERNLTSSSSSSSSLPVPSDLLWINDMVWSLLPTIDDIHSAYKEHQMKENRTNMQNDLEYNIEQFYWDWVRQHVNNGDNYSNYSNNNNDSDDISNHISNETLNRTSPKSHDNHHPQLSSRQPSLNKSTMPFNAPESSHTFLIRANHYIADGQALGVMLATLVDCDASDHHVNNNLDIATTNHANKDPLALPLSHQPLILATPPSAIIDETESTAVMVDKMGEIIASMDIKPPNEIEPSSSSSSFSFSASSSSSSSSSSQQPTHGSTKKKQSFLQSIISIILWIPQSIILSIAFLLCFIRGAALNFIENRCQGDHPSPWATLRSGGLAHTATTMDTFPFTPFPLRILKEIRTHAHCTINDVSLILLGGLLRRHTLYTLFMENKGLTEEVYNEAINHVSKWLQYKHYNINNEGIGKGSRGQHTWVVPSSFIDMACKPLPPSYALLSRHLVSYPDKIRRSLPYFPSSLPSSCPPPGHDKYHLRRILSHCQTNMHFRAMVTVALPRGYPNIHKYTLHGRDPHSCDYESDGHEDSHDDDHNNDTQMNKPKAWYDLSPLYSMALTNHSCASMISFYTTCIDLPYSITDTTIDNDVLSRVGIQSIHQVYNHHTKSSNEDNQSNLLGSSLLTQNDNNNNTTTTNKNNNNNNTTTTTTTNSNNNTPNTNIDQSSSITSLKQRRSHIKSDRSYEMKYDNNHHDDYKYNDESNNTNKDDNDDSLIIPTPIQDLHVTTTTTTTNRPHHQRDNDNDSDSSGNDDGDTDLIAALGMTRRQSDSILSSALHQPSLVLASDTTQKTWKDTRGMISNPSSPEIVDSRRRQGSVRHRIRHAPDSSITNNNMISSGSSTSSSSNNATTTTTTTNSSNKLEKNKPTSSSSSSSPLQYCTECHNIRWDESYSSINNDNNDKTETSIPSAPYSIAQAVKRYKTSMPDQEKVSTSSSSSSYTSSSSSSSSLITTTTTPSFEDKVSFLVSLLCDTCEPTRTRISLIHKRTTAMKRWFEPLTTYIIFRFIYSLLDPHTMQHTTLDTASKVTMLYSNIIGPSRPVWLCGSSFQSCTFSCGGIPLPFAGLITMNNHALFTLSGPPTMQYSYLLDTFLHSELRHICKVYNISYTACLPQ